MSCFPSSLTITNQHDFHHHHQPPNTLITHLHPVLLETTGFAWRAPLTSAARHTATEINFTPKRLPASTQFCLPIVLPSTTGQPTEKIFFTWMNVSFTFCTIWMTRHIGCAEKTIQHTILKHPDRPAQVPDNH